jgi:hypothetical protein
MDPDAEADRRCPALKLVSMLVVVGAEVDVVIVIALLLPLPLPDDGVGVDDLLLKLPVRESERVSGAVSELAARCKVEKPANDVRRAFFSVLLLPATPSAALALSSSLALAFPFPFFSCTSSSSSLSTSCTLPRTPTSSVLRTSRPGSRGGGRVIGFVSAFVLASDPQLRLPLNGRGACTDVGMKMDPVVDASQRALVGVMRGYDGVITRV